MALTPVSIPNECLLSVQDGCIELCFVETNYLIEIGRKDRYCINITEMVNTIVPIMPLTPQGFVSLFASINFTGFCEFSNVINGFDTIPCRELLFNVVPGVNNSGIVVSDSSGNLVSDTELADRIVAAIATIGDLDAYDVRAQTIGTDTFVCIESKQVGLPLGATLGVAIRPGTGFFDLFNYNDFNIISSVPGTPNKVRDNYNARLWIYCVDDQDQETLLAKTKWHRLILGDNNQYQVCIRIDGYLKQLLSTAFYDEAGVICLDNHYKKILIKWENRDNLNPQGVVSGEIALDVINALGRPEEGKSLEEFCSCIDQEVPFFTNRPDGFEVCCESTVPVAVSICASPDAPVNGVWCGSLFIGGQPITFELDPIEVTSRKTLQYNLIPCELSDTPIGCNCTVLPELVSCETIIPPIQITEDIVLLNFRAQDDPADCTISITNFFPEDNGAECLGVVTYEASGFVGCTVSSSTINAGEFFEVNPTDTSWYFVYQKLCDGLPVGDPLEAFGGYTLRYKWSQDGPFFIAPRDTFSINATTSVWAGMQDAGGYLEFFYGDSLVSFTVALLDGWELDTSENFCNYVELQIIDTSNACYDPVFIDSVDFCEVDAVSLFLKYLTEGNPLNFTASCSSGASKGEYILTFSSNGETYGAVSYNWSYSLDFGATYQNFNVDDEPDASITFTLSDYGVIWVTLTATFPQPSGPDCELTVTKQTEFGNCYVLADFDMGITTDEDPDECEDFSTSPVTITISNPGAGFQFSADFSTVETELIGLGADCLYIEHYVDGATLEVDNWNPTFLFNNIACITYGVLIQFRVPSGHILRKSATIEVCTSSTTIEFELDCIDLCAGINQINFNINDLSGSSAPLDLDNWYIYYSDVPELPDPNEPGPVPNPFTLLPTLPGEVPIIDSIDLNEDHPKYVSIIREIGSECGNSQRIQQLCIDCVTIDLCDYEIDFDIEVQNAPCAETGTVYGYVTVTNITGTRGDVTINLEAIELTEDVPYQITFTDPETNPEFNGVIVVSDCVCSAEKPFTVSVEEILCGEPTIESFPLTFLYPEDAEDHVQYINDNDTYFLANGADPNLYPLGTTLEQLTPDQHYVYYIDILWADVVSDYYTVTITEGENIIYENLNYDFASIRVYGLKCDRSYTVTITSICTSGDCEAESTYSANTVILCEPKSPEPCVKCPEIENLTSDTIVDNGNIVFAWKSYENSDGYKIRIRDYDSSTWNVTDETTITDSIHIVEGLTNCNTYEFEVINICNEELGIFSQAWSNIIVRVEDPCEDCDICECENDIELDIICVDNTFGADTVSENFQGTVVSDVWTVSIPSYNDGEPQPYTPATLICAENFDGSCYIKPIDSLYLFNEVNSSAMTITQIGSFYRLCFTAISGSYSTDSINKINSWASTLSDPLSYITLRLGLIEVRVMSESILSLLLTDSKIQIDIDPNVSINIEDTVCQDYAITIQDALSQFLSQASDTTPIGIDCILLDSLTNSFCSTLSTGCVGLNDNILYFRGTRYIDNNSSGILSYSTDGQTYQESVTSNIMAIAELVPGEEYYIRYEVNAPCGTIYSNYYVVWSSDTLNSATLIELDSECCPPSCITFNRTVSFEEEYCNRLSRSITVCPTVGQDYTGCECDQVFPPVSIIDCESGYVDGDGNTAFMMGAGARYIGDPLEGFTWELMSLVINGVEQLTSTYAHTILYQDMVFDANGLPLGYGSYFNTVPELVAAGISFQEDLGKVSFPDNIDFVMVFQQYDTAGIYTPGRAEIITSLSGIVNIEWCGCFGVIQQDFQDIAMDIYNGIPVPGWAPLQGTTCT